MLSISFVPQTIIIRKNELSLGLADKGNCNSNMVKTIQPEFHFKVQQLTVIYSFLWLSHTIIKWRITAHITYIVLILKVENYFT